MSLRISDYFLRMAVLLIILSLCIGQYWAHNKHSLNVERKLMNTMILKAWISLWNQLEGNFKDQETELGIFSLTHLKAILKKIRYTLWICLSYCWDQFLSLNIQESVIICSVGTHKGVLWHLLLTQVRDCLKEAMSSCFFFNAFRAYVPGTNEIQS